jgi:hypothetical protein
MQQAASGLLSQHGVNPLPLLRWAKLHSHQAVLYSLPGGPHSPSSHLATPAHGGGRNWPPEDLKIWLHDRKPQAVVSLYSCWQQLGSADLLGPINKSISSVCTSLVCSCVCLHSFHTVDLNGLVSRDWIPFCQVWEINQYFLYTSWWFFKIFEEILLEKNFACSYELTDWF